MKPVYSKELIVKRLHAAEVTLAGVRNGEHSSFSETELLNLIKELRLELENKK